MNNNLRELRKSKKLTLKDLEKKTSMTSSTLSRLELGDQNIYLDQAIELANFFGVSVDEIANRDWHDPEKTIIKVRDFEYKDILNKLELLSDKELSNIAGAIDYILETRDNEYGSEVRSSNVRTQKDDKSI